MDTETKEAIRLLKITIANNKRHETKRYNALKEDYNNLRNQFIKLKTKKKKTFLQNMLQSIKKHVL